MNAYYNENEPYVAQWLRNLIDANLITKGEVDERSIKDVRPDDLKGFTRCHFFAGISGWELGLQRAGWGDEEVWTGSCPCQPFSVAGKQLGAADERHLWPEFYRLIRERRPAVVFGEQVAAASQWLAGVRSDLEAVGYAVGAAPVEAASAGAPQFRDRFWFVASLQGERGDGGTRVQGPHGRPFAEAGGVGELPSPHIECESDSRLQRGGELGETGCDPQSVASELAYQYLAGLEGRKGIAGDDGTQCSSPERSSVSSLVSDPSLGWGEGWAESEFRSRGFTAAVASLPDPSGGPEFQFIKCPDGKWRRLPPPRVCWLGNGIPARVAKLRAFGNAIVPAAAAEFISAFMEARP